MKSSSVKRKRIWIGIGIVVLIFLVAAGFMFARNQRAENENQAQVETGDIITAFMGRLDANATASGQVQAQREAQLSLSQPGQVSDIFAEVGQTVQAGDPLLKLDTPALERAVRSAEQNLVIQEANLASLTDPPRVSDLAAAEAAVKSSQTQLDDLLAGPLEEDISASEANIRATQANVWAASEQLQLAQSGANDSEIATAQAELISALGQQESTQELYDQLLKCFSFSLPSGDDREICPGLGAPEEQTRFNLEAATANSIAAQAKLDALLAGPDSDAVGIAQASLAAANAQLEATEANHALLLRGASEDQIAAAKANLAQSQANLQTLNDGPSLAQLFAMETAVEQARIALEKAERDLVEATLVAPFDGVITAVNVDVGEVANGILVELFDPNSLEIVLDVDEADIANVQVGQTAIVTLETWPDTEITSEVVSIAPEAKNDNSALVVFEVYLKIGESELPVLLGMTADAALLASDNEEVLLVPNAAINADRNTGTFTVNKVFLDAEGNQVTEEVEVSINLRDGRYTQVIDGLVEGDQVLIGNTLPVFEFGDGPPPEGARGNSGGPPGAFGG